jgi:hypothetical protein
VVVGNALVVFGGVGGHQVAEPIAIPAIKGLTDGHLGIGSLESVVDLALQHHHFVVEYLVNVLDAGPSTDQLPDQPALGIGAHVDDAEPSAVRSLMEDRSFAVASFTGRDGPCVSLRTSCIWGYPQGT